MNVNVADDGVNSNNHSIPPLCSSVSVSIPMLPFGFSPLSPNAVYCVLCVVSAVRCCPRCCCAVLCCSTSQRTVPSWLCSQGFSHAHREMVIFTKGVWLRFYKITICCGWNLARNSRTPTSLFLCRQVVPNESRQNASQKAASGVTGKLRWCARRCVCCREVRAHL